MKSGNLAKEEWKFSKYIINPWENAPLEKLSPPKLSPKFHQSSNRKFHLGKG
jgi:hypothetical protein